MMKRSTDRCMPLLVGLLACGILYASDSVIDTEGGHASIQFRISHLGFNGK
jgi:hypothetical protein